MNDSDLERDTYAAMTGVQLVAALEDELLDVYHSRPSIGRSLDRIRSIKREIIRRIT